MERTNRPIQVETRAPAGRQSRGVGQSSGRQDSQWADGLAQEYNHKLSGQSPAAYEGGQEEQGPEGQSVPSGDLASGRGQSRQSGAMGQNAGGRSYGRTPQGSSRQQGFQDTGGGQPYGDNGRSRSGGQAYGRSGYAGTGYRQGEQALGSEGNRQGGRTDGERVPFGIGQTGRGYGGMGDGGQTGQAGTARTQAQHAGAGTGRTGERAGNSGGWAAGNRSQQQTGAGTGNIGGQYGGTGTGTAGGQYGGAGTGTAGRQYGGAGTGTAGRQYGGTGTGTAGGQYGGAGIGTADGQSSSAGTGTAGLQQAGAGAGTAGRRQAGAGAGTAGLQQAGAYAGNLGGRQNSGPAGAGGGRQGNRTAGTGGRQQKNKTAANNGRSRNNGQAANKDRRPPGTAAGKKGRFGSKGGKAGKTAGAKGRTGAERAAYEDAGSFQSQNTGVQVQQRTGQRAKLPGYGSNGRRKPGSGVNFLVQGSILAAAGIIVRLIGMVYRIPLARKIGDVGNGYYNAAYSIYSILLIMSSYSLPTAVSKMVSARLAKGQYRTSTKIFRASMFYATVAGMAGFCALWFGADYFAGEIIKMPYSSYALKSLAPTIWIMAYLGVLRGYFQGHSTMIPTAVSQIFEQVVNAVISIVAASVLFDMGIKSNLVFQDTEYSYAFGAAGGAIGTGAGALTALVLFLILTMGYVPTMRKQSQRDRGNRVESYGAISRALFVTIVPIIISSAIYNISNVVDNSIFGHVMEGLGESGQTASQWGVYMGRYHMLFNIPVAIANSLSSSLIPSLSRAAAEKNRKEILSKIGSAIRFSMIIAIPSAVGLTVLAGPVSNLLFSGMDNEMLIKMMLVGSSAVVFFSLSTVSNAILQGINHMQVPIINSAVSLGIHVGALYVMLGVFHMGIYSVVYANILFAGLVCILNAISIARYTKYRQEIVKTFLIPCAASAAMGGAAWGVHYLCAKAGNAVSTAAAIFAAILVYFVLLLKLKGVDAQELRSMPGGTRILGAARKLRLM